MKASLGRLLAAGALVGALGLGASAPASAMTDLSPKTLVPVQVDDGTSGSDNGTGTELFIEVSSVTIDDGSGGPGGSTGDGSGPDDVVGSTTDDANGPERG